MAITLTGRIMWNLLIADEEQQVEAYVLTGWQLWQRVAKAMKTDEKDKREYDSFKNEVKRLKTVGYIGAKKPAKGNAFLHNSHWAITQSGYTWWHDGGGVELHFGDEEEIRTPGGGKTRIVIEDYLKKGFHVVDNPLDEAVEKELLKRYRAGQLRIAFHPNKK